MCVFWKSGIVGLNSQSTAVPRPATRRSSGSYGWHQINLTTDTVDGGWCELSCSHSFLWEPHMVTVSLNTSHHLTQQTLVLLIDSINAKKVKHIKAPPPSSILSPFISIHLWVLIIHPVFTVTCLLTFSLPLMLFTPLTLLILQYALSAGHGFPPALSFFVLSFSSSSSSLSSCSSCGSVMLEWENGGWGGGGDNIIAAVWG